jgi:transcriptional regulator with XRE-family HTH domain
MHTAVVLTAARARAGLSTRQLARRAGTSHSTITAYERGAKSPSAATLARLVVACGFELDVALRPRSGFENRAERGRELREVLDLADRLPQGGKPALTRRFGAA